MNPSDYIAPHFRFAEVIHTSVRGVDNTPGDLETENLIAVVGHIAQPARTHFDRPVVVTSGYRSPAVNAAVGGSKTSQHKDGEALDFKVVGVDHFTVARWIARGLVFDQLILEFVGDDGFTGWIHCSYTRHRRNRMQMLRAGSSGGRVWYRGIILSDIPAL
jgi:hypothetical protein